MKLRSSKLLYPDLTDFSMHLMRPISVAKPPNGCPNGPQVRPLNITMT
uniref:Uncharacterized protein n=1 Tax=Rhizophora mucronata TaxID=61149 RepID=A0A2P2QQI4_RHIMU